MDQHTDPQPEGDHSPAAPDKPTTFQGDLRNLPPTLEPLKEKPNWVLWRWKFRGIKDGKKEDWTKVPYQPNGRNAKGNDFSTWSTYEACIAAFDGGDFDGIGFCLLNSGFNAFDVDKCRDKQTGELKVQAQKLLKQCGDTYAEVTVSGTGIRIIGLGVSNVDRQKKYPVGNGVSIEVYRCIEKGRYITISGSILPGHEAPLKNIDDVIDEVYEECEAHRTDGSAAISGPNFADTDGFEAIEPDDPRLAGLSEKWIALGHDGTGIAEKYNGDRSRAVMAFASECFRAGIAEEITAALLMRWKIGEHIRDQSNVVRALNRTIDKARQFVENSKLFEMNEKHAVLPIGGKTRVVTFGEMEDFPGRETIVMTQTIPDFKLLNDKYRHFYRDEKGELKSIPLGTCWISSQMRRQYDGGMAFMPHHDGDVGDKLNLWRGFGVKAIKPDGKSGAEGCQRFLDFMRDIICSGDETNFDYLRKREATILQKRIRSEVALGLQTDEEGCGKGFYEKTMRRLTGHAMQLSNPDHIIGKFNPHLEILLRLTADEALFVGDPKHRNALFGLVTEPELTIEPKNCGVYVATSYLNITCTCNSKHFLPVSNTARRFFIPTVSAARIQDFVYFAGLQTELDNGGYEALLYHLLHEVDLRDFNVRKVPQTEGLRRQRDLSLPPLDAWWCELLESGTLWGADPRQPNEAVSNSYQRMVEVKVPYIGTQIRHVNQLGIYDQAKRIEPRLQTYTSDRLLGGHLTEMGCDNTDKVLRRRGWSFPPLKECRARWEKRYPKWEWRNPELTEWQPEVDGVDVVEVETAAPARGEGDDEVPF